jgi:hypothetical protein
MTENLMNKAHKSTNPEYRKGHDKVKWDRDKKRKEDGK